MFLSEKRELNPLSKNMSRNRACPKGLLGFLIEKWTL
jgi:hypothetical protein